MRSILHKMPNPLKGSVMLLLTSLATALNAETPLEQKHLKSALPLIFQPEPVNIGYPSGNGPVPLTGSCLLDQAITGDTTTIYSGSAVQPSIAVNPTNCKNIVACWQQGRISNTGALEAGIAYSTDGGKKWKRTTVPLQICTGGINQRISDTWLSYSKDGSRVYLSALVFNANQTTDPIEQTAIIVSTSLNNGKDWSAPSYLITSQDYYNETSGIYLYPVNDSVTADRNIASNAYVVYDVFDPVISFHTETYFNRTTDGGGNWSPAVSIYNPYPDLVATGLTNPALVDATQTVANVVVVQPKVNPSTPKLNGDLLNFMVRIYGTPTATQSDFDNDVWPYQYSNFDIAVIRSQDQGVTWNTTSTVITGFTDSLVYSGGYTYDLAGNVTGGVGVLLRTGDIVPSYNVNPKNGNLYVAYQTGEFTDSKLPQIGLKASYDGGYTWTNSARVSRTPLSAANPQAFTPFVAVTENGYVGILYFDFRTDNLADPNNTPTNAWLAVYKETGSSTGGSTGIGLQFVGETRLTCRPYNIQNGPDAGGIMTNGDYAFLDAQHKSFYASYIVATTGPYAPAETFYDDPSTDTVILLDRNYRTTPYFHVITP